MFCIDMLVSMVAASIWRFVPTLSVWACAKGAIVYGDARREAMLQFVPGETSRCSSSIFTVGAGVRFCV